MRKHWILTVILLTLAGIGRASIPTNETFDLLTSGSDFIPAQNGWGANVTNIVVTTAKAQSGTKSVDITEGLISNNVGELAPAAVVWTEFHLIPHLGAAMRGLPTNEANHVHFYDTNGYLNVLTPSGYVTLTADIHGNPLAPVDTNNFNRVSIYQNFNSATSAVLLDGVVVLQDVHFPGSSTAYHEFGVKVGGTQSAFLDTYSVGATVPASADGNGNGTPDAQELNDRGYVARNFTVGESGNEDFNSLSAAAAVARTGDRIIVTNVIGTLDGGGAATFNGNVTITGVDFTTDHAVIISAGCTVTVADVAMDVNDAATFDGTLVLGSAGSFLANNAIFDDAGAIDSGGGTWGVDVPYVVLTGPFDISGAAWNNANAESALNFADTFEQYALGVELGNLAFRGWGASDTNAQVSSLAGQQGGRSASVYGVVSNRINGVGAPKVWTDLQLYARRGRAPDGVDPASSSVVFYFNTNGYLSVYSGGGWVECATTAGGGPATPVTTGAWARVSVFTDYGSDKAALFVNGQLLREQIGFPSGGAANYSLLGIANRQAAAVAIDAVSVSQLEPTGLAGDVDGDTRLDADEIHQYGTISAVGYPASIFLFH